MLKPIRIIATRKLQPNHRQYLLNANLAVIEADFISVSSTKPLLENIADNLIFTSQNAVKSILENDAEPLKGKKCFCVGTKTKQMLESNGFTVVAFAEYASELGKIISEQYRDENFTFFSGNLRLDTLPNIFEKSNINFNEIQVYQTLLTPQKIEAKADAILFFSPSGVESFLTRNSITDETCFCIGETTASALTVKNSIIANQPTVENVIIQCINHYK